MEILLQVILLWYFLPLVISFSFTYICVRHDLKTNESSELEILFGFSFLPAVNILILLVVLGTFVMVLGEEFGKFLIKTIIKK